ncbi:MAG: NAD(P)H-dependent oxidoreductase [Pseudomonadota bacterium]
MAKRIFIWVGHPRADSLSHGLADAYQRGAKSRGAEIRRMHVGEMTFDLDEFGGYKVKRDLEPDLKAWQEAITWSQRMVWVYPYWWGAMPAKMKAVVDRALLPGFGFLYRKDSVMWDKLLGGHVGDGIITSDTPPWYDTLLYSKPGRRVLKNQIYKFTGIKPGKIVQIGTIKTANEDKIKAWLEMAHQMGVDAAS